MPVSAVSIIDLAAVLPYGGKLVPVVPVVPIDGGKLLPIIQGHGSQRSPSCPSCRVVPAVPIDGGKLVPIIDLAARSCPVADDRRRERRADHPGPRLATAAGGNGARGARRADRQPGTSCRSSTWLRGARAGRVDHRPCRGPALLPRLDSREAGADHPGPRVATAAVVPVVPIDGGKLVPIIDLAARSCPVADRRRERRARRAGAGNGRGRARGAGRADRRREGGAAPRQPGSWCRSSRATGGNGRGPVADDRRREAGAGARNGRRRAGRVDHRACRGPARCRSSTWLRGPVLLPMIDGGKLVPALATAAVVPVVPSRAGRADRRREAGADHPGPRVATVPVVPVVPIDSRERRAAPRQPGSWCPWCRSSRATGGNGARGARRADRQPGTSCPWCRVVPAVSIDGGKLLPIIDLAARSCPVADDRRRERRADHRPGCAVPVPAVSIIDLAAVLPCCRASTAGKLVPIIQGHGWQRPRSCPWCRSTAGSWCRSSTWLRGPALLPIDAGNVVPVVPALATAAVVPVVPAVPIDGGKVVPRLDSREAGADHPGPRVATAAVLLPMIDAGKLVPARNGRRRAGRVDHRACRGPALLPIIDLAARCRSCCR